MQCLISGGTQWHTIPGSSFFNESRIRLAHSHLLCFMNNATFTSRKNKCWTWKNMLNTLSRSTIWTLKTNNIKAHHWTKYIVNKCTNLTFCRSMLSISASIESSCSFVGLRVCETMGGNTNSVMSSQKGRSINTKHWNKENIIFSLKLLFF